VKKEKILKKSKSKIKKRVKKIRLKKTPSLKKRKILKKSKSKIKKKVKKKN
tara:strand:+ start:372 stop:524 length:153 start_codon:yes stop_codon:yes gene_type:complete